jgi:hypothetical protein
VIYKFGSLLKPSISLQANVCRNCGSEDALAVYGEVGPLRVLFRLTLHFSISFIVAGFECCAVAERIRSEPLLYLRWEV